MVQKVEDRAKHAAKIRSVGGQVGKHKKAEYDIDEGSRHVSGEVDEEYEFFNLPR